MKNSILKCFTLLLVILLSSCTVPSFTGLSVEDLLRAPQTSLNQNAVQKALNSYLGETMQLKYPRSGDEMTPFIIHDFDGDGVDEAAVLYVTTAKGRNVHLAMLENEGGTWEVVYEIEGLSSEVLMVEFAKIEHGDQDSLVIGFSGTNTTDKYLGVYTYLNETITPRFTQSYSNYLVHDLDDDEVDELLFMAPGAPSMQLIKSVDGQMKILDTKNLDERFVACNSIAAGKNGLITVDGVLQSGVMSSELIVQENGELNGFKRQQDDKLDIFLLTRRYQSSLISHDIDNNGHIEVPVVLSAVKTLSTTQRFYYVVWCDFTKTSYEKIYGIYDATYNYFLELPNSWRAQEFTIMDDGTANGGWQLRSKDGTRMIVSAKIMPRSSSDGIATQVATFGDKSLYLSFGQTATLADITKITNGVFVM